MSDINQRLLAPRIERFCVEFMKDGCAGAASRRAGYSERTARQQGSRLLQQPAVAERLREHRERVQAKQAQVVDQIRLDGEHTRRVLAQLCYFDAREFVHSDGTPKALHELSESQAHAIERIEVSERWEGEGDDRRKVVTTRVRFANRLAALDKAARILGLYRPHNHPRRDFRELTDAQLRQRAQELLGGTLDELPMD